MDFHFRCLSKFVVIRREITCVKICVHMSPNENCRFCGCSFKVKYGSYLSSENLFRASKRSDAYGVILSDVCAGIGIELIQNNEQLSDRCCNPRARRVRNLGQLHAFILKNANDQCKNPEKPKSANKRQLDTPNRSSPAWGRNKAARMCKPPTPKSRKCLNMSENIDPASSKRNIPKDLLLLSQFLGPRQPGRQRCFSEGKRQPCNSVSS